MGIFVAFVAGPLVPIGVLGELVSIGTLLAFVIVCAGVWILRKRRPDLHRPFKTPMVPLVPILGIIISLGLMASLPLATWIRLIVWLIIGMVIYFTYGRHHSNVQKHGAGRGEGRRRLVPRALAFLGNALPLREGIFVARRTPSRHNGCGEATLLNLKLVFLALVALVLVGIAGFHFLEGWTWFEGFYMVLTTITTIGYGEVHPLSHAGRIVQYFVIIAGVGLVLLFFGGATAGFARIRAAIGIWQETHGPRDQPIVGPLHHLRRRTRGPQRGARVGAQAAALRRRRYQRRPSWRSYSAEGWLTLAGDATQAHVLREASHRACASGLVAATTTDATNIYIILTARSLNPKLKIIARASEEDAEKHLLTAGADSVVSPYRLCRLPHCANLYASARGGLLRHRHEPAAARWRSRKCRCRRVRASPAQTLESSRIRQEMGVIVLAIKGEDSAHALQSAARRSHSCGRPPHRHGRS